MASKIPVLLSQQHIMFKAMCWFLSFRKRCQTELNPENVCIAPNCKFVLLALCVIHYTYSPGTFANTYIYDDFGRVKEVYLQDRHITYNYDNMGNRASVSIISGGLDTNFDLGVNATVTPVAQIIGSPMRYRVTVSNYSQVSASNLTLQISSSAAMNMLPPEFLDWACSGSSMISCTSLGLFDEETLTFTLIPTQTGENTISVTLSSTETDINLANNTVNSSVFISASGIAGDTDGDGIPDSWETQNGFDPIYSPDALLDSDGDGVSNLGEFLAGTNPNDSDMDNDGMPNAWEIAHGLNPNDASDAVLDPDLDRLSNLEEYIAGTDPNNPDTDNDGIDDSVDQYPTVNLGVLFILIQSLDEE